jgi:hypothetical protein
MFLCHIQAKQGYCQNVVRWNRNFRKSVCWEGSGRLTYTKRNSDQIAGGRGSWRAVTTIISYNHAVHCRLSQPATWKFSSRNCLVISGSFASLFRTCQCAANCECGSARIGARTAGRCWEWGVLLWLRQFSLLLPSQGEEMEMVSSFHLFGSV